MTEKAIYNTPDAVKRNPEQSEGLSLIEHLAAQSSGRCKNPSAPILFGQDTTNKKAIVIRSACKLWSCEPCGAAKARKWIAKTINGVNEMEGGWFFATLTARGNRRTQEMSLQDFRTGWVKLRKRITRKFGSFEYVRILEQHKDGVFHMHLIMNAEIPTKQIAAKKDKPKHFYCRYLKDKAFACGLGYKADYQPIRSAAGAAYYVAKYLTKSIGAAGATWPKNVHRIRTSNNWPALPELVEESELEWEYIRDHNQLWMAAHLARDSGYKLYGNHGEPMTAIGMVIWMRKLQGYDYDKQRNSNESSSNGDRLSDKLDAETHSTTKRLVGNNERSLRKHAKKQRNKEIPCNN